MPSATSLSRPPSHSISSRHPLPAIWRDSPSTALLCASLAGGTCTPVGSATADSPLYPKPLTGQAYLTGSFTGLTLTLIFPSPFPLTLTGSVDLATNATTFTGLPDIPLTDLTVTLDPGRYALFEGSCATPSGTATAALTDQNGDKTATVPARFTLGGCSSSTGGGSRGQGRAAGARLSAVSFSGLRTGHPALRFRVSGSRLARLTVELPGGLRFAGRRGLRHGVTVSGGGIRSASIGHGHLVIVLRRAVTAASVTIRPPVLGEGAALRRRARAHRLRRLVLTVVVANPRGQRLTLREPGGVR